MLLTVHGLTAGYGSEPVLDGLSFELEPGERIGVLGPNGGGKTTLFKALLGMLPLLAGHIDSAGRFGYVPQTERSRLD
jgi:ABC-type Mn2+/Zn2+ transport system ATPase subunit